MQRPGLEQNAALLAMLTACIAVFLTAIDQTVVVTALPQIIADLQIAPTQLDHAAWIVSGYLLGYVIVMPLMGRVSDMYGRRRIFIICLGIFALGSLLCGLAPMLGNSINIDFLQNVGIDTSIPGLVWLVAARFVQAAGGGAIVPVAMAIAGDFYGDRRRGLALGLVGMVTEAGGVLGPLYGSLIVQFLGWQYIFYLNLPIVAVLLFLIIRFIPAGATRDSKERIDSAGALLLGTSLVCLSLGLAQQAAQITPATVAPGGEQPGNNPWLLSAAFVLLAAFIALEFYTERRARWPVIALSLFKRAMFTATSLVSLLIGCALIIAMVDIPIFFLTVYNASSLDSGLALLRLTALIPLGALVGGWLCVRMTCRWTAVLGLLPTVLGFWLMHLWPLHADWTLITISTMLTGLGLGLVIAPISTTAIDAAGNHRLGMASSVVTVLRMTGMILGLAALTSWGLGRFRAQVATFKPPAGVPALSAKYNILYAHFVTIAAHDIYTSIFLAAGIICALALLPALYLEGRKPAGAFVRSTDNSTVKDGTSNEQADSRQESKAGTRHGQRER